MTSWLKHHLQVLFYTLGQLSQNRLSASMTLLAIGIGISIPIIMYSVVDGFAHIGGQWQERPQITLYLDKSISEQQTIALKAKLEQDQRLGNITYISAQQGLHDFSLQNHFDDAIALLDENPLPAVFVLYPKHADNAEKIAQLSNEFNQLEQVSSAQYDFEWLQKLSALTSFLKRIAIVLAWIISIGILLLIANTLRLEISTRKDEIIIIDQLGGTPAFIARPFLYLGLLTGFFGGITAIILSMAVLAILSKPLLRLAELYSFTINMPLSRIDIIAVVLISSSLLGWLSARFTVYKHMQNLKAV